MNDAYFIFNEKSSLEFGIKILNTIEFTSPERDIEFVQVPGRNGELAVDNGRYKDIVKSFDCHIKAWDGATLDVQARKIIEWLTENNGYGELYFSGNEGYYYKALFFESAKFAEKFRRYGEATIEFKCEPIMYRTDKTTIPITAGVPIYNPEKIASQPLIHVQGSGDLDIIIVDSDIYNNLKNSVPLVYDEALMDLGAMEPRLKLRGVVGEILIDTKTAIAYRSQVGMVNSCVHSKVMPEIKPGFRQVIVADPSNENAIVEKAGFSVYVTPRWGALAI